MLERIAVGVNDVELLAGEARGVLRRKDAQLKEALVGKLEPVYQLLLRQHMDQVRLLRRQIEQVNQALAEAMKEHIAVLHRLSRIPGIDLHASQELIAEIGPKAAAFATAGQFASWVGVCPGSQESAGVNYSNRSPKGNRYLRRLLCQIAWAAIHTKDTFFAGLFGRLKPRIEGKGAAWAVAHRMARVIWLVLHQEVDYQEKGSAPPNERTLLRKFRRLLKDFGNLGVDVRALLNQHLTITG
jgi:transposase